MGDEEGEVGLREVYPSLQVSPHARHTLGLFASLRGFVSFVGEWPIYLPIHTKRDEFPENDLSQGEGGMTQGTHTM